MNNEVAINQELQDKANNILKSVNINQIGALAVGQLRTVIDARINKQQNQGLDLPANYSVSNALTQALLRLQSVKTKGKTPVLQACTPNSIIQSLMDMVVQGLSPAKDQCYFIAYGNELQLRRSYFGTTAALLRLENITDVDAQAIYEGDQVNTSIDRHGHLVLDTENTHLDWTNQDNELIGAYAIITTADGVDHLTIMTKKQIKVSWNQSKTHDVQNKFGSEMAKRTVLNRAAKMFINTSDDSDLLTGAINDTTSNEYDERRDVTPVEDEKQSTDELLEGFQKSQEAKAKGVSNNGNNNEGKEESSEEIANGQTELFSKGTIKPADEADS
ncbi:recombinase RecT [Limosilactobacillus reuteri]|uniref:Recombinase RecT n=1 Tax=Limosilactobacillus reuteri TaxID=1598 RepID=A0A3M6SAT9_LIMRT|nr:RecT family recombinase [Limosilactobacillus reuteri]RMX24401.1 recombinase RecT [Limosilactobacillus reuteri]